eukprot:scaffold77515_cov19-Tisochrysis_lutea.AAC.1
MPQAPTSHTSFPAGQAVPKSAARLPAQAAAAAAAPAGDCPEVCGEWGACNACDPRSSTCMGAIALGIVLNCSLAEAEPSAVRPLYQACIVLAPCVSSMHRACSLCDL